MSTNKRVFVAAWEYPPLMSGESVVCRRTLEHSSFDYDVCCGPLEVSGNDHIRIFPLSGNKYLRWPFAVAREFTKRHKENAYAVMMSRVMPPNGHLAGWLIKLCHPEVKWIAYFSDPVWNSPFLKPSFRNDGSHRPKWVVMKLFGIPCYWALKRADILMFNNERLARYILGRQYDTLRSKVLIAPYGHEGVAPKMASKRVDGKLTLTHVGQIYGNRTFSALLDGLTVLKQSNPKVYETLRIRQVGFVCQAERKRVEHSAVHDRFTFVDTVPYEESLAEMYRSDCLLVIDPTFDRSQKNIYIPGKLFDYLSTGKPILCIAQEDSATGAGVKSWGCLRVDPNGQAVAKGLEELPLSLEHYEYTNYLSAHCKVGVKQLDESLQAMFSMSKNQMITVDTVNHRGKE